MGEAEVKRGRRKRNGKSETKRSGKKEKIREEVRGQVSQR